MRDCKINI